MMTIQELKEYIYKEVKIEFILESIGCHSIKYHQNKNTIVVLIYLIKTVMVIIKQLSTFIMMKI